MRAAKIVGTSGFLVMLFFTSLVYARCCPGDCCEYFDLLAKLSLRGVPSSEVDKIAGYL
jgi:hypothetical protein